MKKIFLALLLTLCLFSCKKNNLKKDKKLLIDNYTTYFNGLEYNKEVFKYDSQNRMTESEYSYLDYSEKKTVIFSYKYDSFGNLVNRNTLAEISSESIFYYTNGMLVKDEHKPLVDNPAILTGIYSVANGRVNKYVTTSSLRNDSTVYEYSYGEDNLKKYKVNGNTVEFYYGDKNNPFKYTGYNLIINNSVDYFRNQSDLVRTVISNSRTTRETIYNNTYNEYGYPVEVTYDSNNVFTNQEGTFKVVYQYKETQ